MHVRVVLRAARPSATRRMTDRAPPAGRRGVLTLRFCPGTVMPATLHVQLVDLHVVSGLRLSTRPRSGRNSGNPLIAVCGFPPMVQRQQLT